MSKNGGLDQCGTEPFERQQFEHLALKGLKYVYCMSGMGNLMGFIDTCVYVLGQQSSGENHCSCVVSEAAATEKQDAGCIGEPG